VYQDVSPAKVVPTLDEDSKEDIDVKEQKSEI